MKWVFDNATVLYGEDLEIVKGYIVVKDGVIEEVGGGSYRGRKTDVKRGIILPAFTNSHVHLGDSVAKDIGTYRSIVERVGKEGIKHRILKEKKSEVPRAMQATLKEMLSSGTTAFCDFREGGLDGIEELKSALKSPLDSLILGRPDSDEPEELLRHCDGIGISSIGDYTEEELKTISKGVKKDNKLLGIHVAEVEDDTDKALALNPSFVVHLTNASEDGLEKIAKAKIPVVLCPRANAMLGVGMPRFKEIFDSNLVALGTDNVMVNSPNMFREMEFTFKAIRGLYKDYTFNAKEVLKAATINGRKIFGLKDNAIREGNDADFVVVKKGKYLSDPLVALVHRAENSDVKFVVKGDILSPE
ncbi:MAG: amidohydrolase family protein [Candidatus Hydrothermarchaeales archaeon]